MKYSVLAELEKRVKDLETAIKIDSDIIREKDAIIAKLKEAISGIWANPDLLKDDEYMRFLVEREE